MTPKILWVKFMYLAALLLFASVVCTVIILLSITQLLLFVLRVRGAPCVSKECIINAAAWNYSPFPLFHVSTSQPTSYF